MSSRTSLFRVAGVMLLVCAAATEARAHRAADIHVFQPALFSRGIFTVDRPDAAPRWQPSFKLYFNHASTPLRLGFSDAVGTEDVVGNAQGFNLQAQLGLTRWLELGLDFPFVRHSLVDNPAKDQVEGFERLAAPDLATNVDAPEATLRDFRFGLKATILNPNPIGLAVAVRGTLPIGDEEHFAGEDGFTVHPSLITGFNLGPVAVAVDVGYRMRESSLVLWDDPSTAEQAVPLLKMDDELTYGVGVVYMIHRVFGLGAEVYGTIPLMGSTEDVETVVTEYDPSKCPAGSPPNVPCRIRTTRRVDVPSPPVLEAIGGAIISPTRSLQIAVGAGAGALGDERRASLRLFAGITWAPGAEAPPVGVSDRDKDGVPDDRDECADQPEDRDGYNDNDGCPDPDNDADGIKDGADKCPNEPEDEDGHEDKDGCPDLDNDGDGVPDDRDRCPAKAEDKDGVQDEDGCPDLDNDGDGVPDKVDQCPDQPETANNFQDEDGCPDDAPGAVTISKGKINIPQTIRFKRGRAVIGRASYKTLDQIAEKIRTNPQVGRIRIEGHTDASGTKARNRTLSQQRAEAVRRYLIRKGVQANRLVAVGYGSSRPIASNDTRAGRAKNRRVEFVVIQTRGGGR